MKPGSSALTRTWLRQGSAATSMAALTIRITRCAPGSRGMITVSQ
jgi:hypothetical protein